MNLEKWYKDFAIKNKSELGKIELFKDYAEIELDGNGYSVGTISIKITDFSLDKYIDILIDSEGANLNYRIFATWYKGNKEIYKEYIDKKSSLIPYKDSDLLIITYFVGSKNKGKTKVYLPKVKEGEKIKERKANLAAICIDYGQFWELRKRKCEDNLRDSLIMIDKCCVDNKPDLIVLTENFYDRGTDEEYEKTFLTKDSAQIEKLKNKAKEHKVYISFSIRELNEEKRYCNSALLIDRNGEIVSEYYKSHLTMGEYLGGMVPGEEAVVYDCDFGRVGFAVCWDLYFPEFVRRLTEMGAEIIINPSSGYDKRRNTERALENGVYIVTAGRFRNNTSIISPDGEMLDTAVKNGVARKEVVLNKRWPCEYLSSDSYSDRRNVFHYERRFDIYSKPVKTE